VFFTRVKTNALKFNLFHTQGKGNMFNAE